MIILGLNLEILYIRVNGLVILIEEDKYYLDLRVANGRDVFIFQELYFNYGGHVNSLHHKSNNDI